MRCPRHKSPLKAELLQGVAALRCLECSGIWVDWVSLESLGIAVGPQELRGLKPSRSELCCLNDNSRLFLINHLSVEVDICPRCHGIWFDLGELEKALTVQLDAVDSEAAGGLLAFLRGLFEHFRSA